MIVRILPILLKLAPEVNVATEVLPATPEADEAGLEHRAPAFD